MGNFEVLFRARKPIIGMIHLAGPTNEDIVKRALDELAIYEEEGLSGAIIEDYHGGPRHVEEVLRVSGDCRIARGVNLLRDPYRAFDLVDRYGAHFVQFDSVLTPDLNVGLYEKLRKEHSERALVLGGVGFKYKEPTGRPLEVDLAEGMSRSDAVVTTGDGTGIETPLDKLRQYRLLLGRFPLIVGAGVNADNVRQQLEIADGAIVGSYFKPDGNTFLPVDRSRVRTLMDVVKELRRKK